MMTTWDIRHKCFSINYLCLMICLSAPGCLQRNSYPARKSAHVVATEKHSDPSTYQSADTANAVPIRTDGYSFAQVSLFGDLPRTAEVKDAYQSGKSLQQHTFAVEGACFDPVVSPDGKMLAFASTQHNVRPDIYIKPTDAPTMTQLTNDPASDVQPAFSPDGGRVAFCSDRTGNWDIFVMDVSGSNLQQLTDDPAPEMHPSFSHDNKLLAYCRYNLRSGQWEVWVLDLSGPGQKRRFITTGLFPTFSPTDSTIVYQRARQRGSRWFGIWQIDLGGKTASMPTDIARSPDRALTAPRWSSDGSYIVYCAVKPRSKGEPGRVTGDAQIWIVGAAGTGKMPVTDPGVGCFSPAWSPDGRIFFCANRGGSENIWSVLPMIEKQRKAGREGSMEANKPATVQSAGEGTVGY